MIIQHPAGRKSKPSLLKIGSLKLLQPSLQFLPRSVSVNAPSCDVEFLGEIHYLFPCHKRQASVNFFFVIFLLQTFIVLFPPSKGLWQARTHERELCPK